MMTITQLKKQLDNKEISAEELLKISLQEIKKHDNDVRAFIEVYENDAFAQARIVDKKRMAGEDLPELAGVPVALKDNILVQGHVASAGSQILEDHVAVYDSTVTERLKKAGAIILGRTNCDEFAMGSSTQVSHYGPTKNPWDLTRVPGGSSGGSVVAVASGYVPGAYGSETGGSVRQPASMCNVVGLKPTYGRISRYGLIALGSSFDQIGPTAHTVEDVATLLRIVEGKDEKDPTSAYLQDTAIGEFLNSENIKGLRIGLPKEYFVLGLDPEVEKLVREMASKLQEHGAEIVEISLPNTQYALAAYYVIQPAEASSNLARFDGIRYSTRSTGENLEQIYKYTRGQNFGREVKRRIMTGTFTLSAGYVDAYYKKALAVRELIRLDFEEAFKDVDLILTPVSPMTAWPCEEKLDDPVQMYLADILTVPVNMAGLPGLSVPCGFANGLPVGAQLIGRAFDEATLFRVGHFYQSLTDWHTKKPW